MRSSRAFSHRRTMRIPMEKLGNARFARYAWGVLAYNLGVILWGAWVRVTGSGAGCGSHWPTCNGEVIPRSASAATTIELTHRITSGLSLLLVLTLFVWVLRATPKDRPARRAATWSVVFLLVEALLGAGLVLFELVAGNRSAARAVAMAAHLVNTLLLLGALTLTAWHASGGGPLGAREHPRASRTLLGAAGALLLVAVTGGIAALGDTILQSGSLAEGLAQDASAVTPLLIRLRVVHPFVATAAGIVLAWVAWRIRADYAEVPRARSAAGAVIALVVAQLAAGLLNLLLLAPGWMQLVHLLLTDVLFIAMVLLGAEALSAPARAPQRAARIAPA